MLPWDSQKAGVFQIPAKYCHCHNVDVWTWRKKSSATHFWRHPVRSSDEGLSFSQGRRDLSRDAEVGELDLAPIREEDVGALDVPMHLAHGVQVDQTLQRFSAHEGDLFFWQRARDWKWRKQKL